MTRLINADAIEYSPLDDIYNRDVMVAFKESIENMPTVDAIPVEWIKQFIKKENIDIINKVGIVDMVEQWKLHPIDSEISSEKCGAKMDGEDEQLPSDAYDQISELVMERLKAEKILEQLGQNLGEVFGKIAETIDDYCNEYMKSEDDNDKKID